MSGKFSHFSSLFIKKKHGDIYNILRFRVFSVKSNSVIYVYWHIQYVMQLETLAQSFKLRSRVIPPPRSSNLWDSTCFCFMSHPLEGYGLIRTTWSLLDHIKHHWNGPMIESSPKTYVSSARRRDPQDLTQRTSSHKRCWYRIARWCEQTRRNHRFTGTVSAGHSKTSCQFIHQMWPWVLL